MDRVTLPLRAGDDGEAVADLQRRLARAGYAGCLADGNCFGEATVEAVRRFQAARGLRSDGICGRQTWAALVEAGYRPGERLLYNRTPMLRGDDVAALQEALGRLGFFADRVDGIFGPRTANALLDFQRNTGLTTDGICGPETVASLGRLGDRAPGQVKGGVVERERLRTAPRELAGRRLVVGEYGGLAALASATGRAVTEAGARVILCQHPDGSQHASEANEFGADAYIGLQLWDEPGCRCAYYGTAVFASAGGAHLAEVTATALSGVLGGAGAVLPMRLPVLRETRMPSVVCEIGPPAKVVLATPALAEMLRRAFIEWVADPLEG
ncbi:MAG: peptidoglycan-binding protein [Actinobacteria bacterium]|nr:peptidoglycan-binding protein [Actinomycetota bacterium]